MLNSSLESSWLLTYIIIVYLNLTILILSAGTFDITKIGNKTGGTSLSLSSAYWHVKNIAGFTKH